MEFSSRHSELLMLSNHEAASRQLSRFNGKGAEKPTLTAEDADEWMNADYCKRAEQELYIDFLSASSHCLHAIQGQLLSLAEDHSADGVIDTDQKVEKPGGAGVADRHKQGQHTYE